MNAAAERKDRGATGAFSPAVIASVILVGVFSFAAYIVLSAYAPSLRDGDNGGTHALSKGATGFAGLAALLRDVGMPVLTPRGPIPDARDGIIVYTPERAAAFDDAAPLDPYQIALIIAPKWTTAPHPLRRGWVLKVGARLDDTLRVPIGEDEIVIELDHIAGDHPVGIEPADAFGGAIAAPFAVTSIGAVESLQFLKASEAIEPLLAANGHTLVGKLKDRPVYIVSDPDLLNTHGLRRVERADLAVGLFKLARAGGPVIFDLSLHGIERTRNIVRLALEPPFLAATLSAILAGLLLALKAASRFGPAAAAPAAHDFGKAALADNSAALIRMAGRESAFAPRYADLTGRRIARAVAAPRTLSQTELHALFDRIAGRKDAGRSFGSMARRAQDVRDPEALVSLARQLHQFKKEIMRERS